MSNPPSSNVLMDFLNGSFNGDPADARAFCERTMTPNFVRLQAGGDRTDFERSVEKIAHFRANGKWDPSMKFFAQDGNKVSARVVGDVQIGDEPAKKLELMIMAEMNEQGLFERIWEQIAEYTTGEE
ncbi:hypothetical protein N7448_003520 [Penicillium atrosanguineum]|uniref:Uncharacterized protein n=1 Tax=Penicillium atrosanguineum TaxID=1132637 RepID=A0A9W9U4W2_9EURO|nr:Pseudouridine synthase RluC/RluD [Penicillium atrosanguineum]KAJ5140112.1 hypothetical protein N7448_003520 [Penicillium atrosanguineum]KAJ5310026.1 Pseudouridine synthase RluC/RluD [Penicillium atrosanguineum]KAJ5315544.1 hypothetical protein N7476_005851 [Penicillium atrosanguineum]